MAAIIEQVGEYRIEFREPVFETLVKSIVYQQLSGRVARVIFDRLAGAMARGSISPEGVLRLRPARMRALGLSKQKTAYIRDLARLTQKGVVTFEALPGLPDADVVEHLTRVKGIGVWTAHMFLIFALRRPNILPTGDLGIRAAMRKAWGLSDLPKPAEMEALSERWHPYRSVASWYLWRSIEPNANL